MGLARDLGFSGLFGASATNPAVLHEIDEDRKVRVGMLFYVLSDMILAIFFFGSYIFLRGYNTNGRWVPPPLAKTIGGGPVASTAWIMGIALASAIIFAIGQWALSHGIYPIFRLGMLVALILFLIDLIFQVYVLGHLGFDLTAGSFATCFILLSGYHVYHMALGVFLGLGVTIRAFRGLYRERTSGTGAEANVSRAYLATARPTGITAEEDHEPPRVSPLPRTTGIAAIGYYWYYAALYSVAVWILLLVQPPLPLSK